MTTTAPATVPFVTLAPGGARATDPCGFCDFSCADIENSPRDECVALLVAAGVLGVLVFTLIICLCASCGKRQRAPELIDYSRYETPEWLLPPETLEQLRAAKRLV